MAQILSENPSRQLDNPQPEFADRRGVFRIFGIRGTFLYWLDRSGKIRSVSIPGRGKTRGKRLYDCESIRRYLAKGE